ncbi:MAG: pyridoxamine 5'-phosphate oxidase family protein [Bacteroidota bacterium]
MTAENNLSFLRDRIFEIKSALLYSLSNELIKMPSSIISILKIDEDGHLWFFANKPAKTLFEDDRIFPARLQFYRKGKPFYLQVAGIACIDENKAEIHALTSQEQKVENTALKDMVLVKLKMTKAEYYEQKQQADHSNTIRHIFQNLYTSLFKPASTYRPFELNTAA